MMGMDGNPSSREAPPADWLGSGETGTLGFSSDAATSTPKPDEIEHLLALLSSDHEGVLEGARRALIAIGSPALVPLVKALSAPNDRVRWEAAKVLVMFRCPDVAPALIAALHDPHPGVRWIAAEGLIRLKRAGLVPLLKALTQRPDSPPLRQAARQVVRALAHARLKPLLSPVLAALGASQPSNELAVASASALEALLSPRRRR